MDPQQQFNPQQPEPQPNPLAPQPPVVPPSQPDPSYAQPATGSPQPYIPQEPSVIAPQPEPAVQPVQEPAPAVQPSSASAPDTFSSNPFLSVGRGLGSTFSTNPLSSILVNFAWLLIFLPPLAIIPLAVIHPLLALVGGIVVLIAIIIILLRVYVGILYVVTESRKGNQVTVRQAIGKGASGHLTPIVFTSILAGIGIFLGFLLLVIPGLILMARWSLFPFVIMNEEQKYMQALKRSFKLTKGHTFEMFGLVVANAFVGGNGLLDTIIGSASMEQRYHELAAFEASGKPTGKVHWLNYVIILLGILFAVAAVAVNALGFMARQNTTLNPEGNDFYFNSDADSGTDFRYDDYFPSDSSSDFEVDYDFE